MIEVKHLTKKYGNNIAIDDLSFSLEKGKIYGFLGPNGAGKSTTMNIMTGYIGASEGDVMIDGFSILEEPAKAKARVGYLPEIPPVYPDMLVGEYLEFAADLKRIKKDHREEKISAVMNITGITSIKDRLIKNLSKGYRQRVGMAQALLGSPDFIVLDEPTVGLDPVQIIEIREMIRSLGERHTVILSSHILAEVQEICDEILIISKGRLVAQGTPGELEKLSGQSSRIEITTSAPGNRIDEVLNQVPGIMEIRYLTDEKETKDSIDVSIETNGDESCAESIFRAFAESGLTLSRLLPVKCTLESVFLELTDRNESDDHAEDREQRKLDVHAKDREQGADK